MMLNQFIKLFLPLCFLASFAQAQDKDLKQIIFDTDMGPDYDDVGAMALLHSFADSGKVNILATIASTKYDGVAAVLNVLNTYFEKPLLPIGVPKGNAITQKDFQHWSDTLISNYPHTIRSNREVPDAIELYRQILSRQPDSSVIIITVGFLTNIANLLQSAPDKFSPLNGKELTSKKVKQLVCMAGKFPAGNEFNVREDAKASAYVFEHWQSPVLFSGFEIGQKIKTGLPLINNASIKNSPVKDVFRISIPMDAQDSAGRMSWDQTAVLVAVKGFQPFYTVKPGRIHIGEDGSNTWKEGATGHFYLVEKKPPAEVQQLIDKLMQYQPL